MAIDIDATIGGLSSNSYITMGRSMALAETLPHMDEWLTGGSIDREQLLVHATRMIDLHFVPKGSKVNSLQALWWPQSRIYYANTTVWIPSEIIPSFVEYATIEWAWAFHENPDPYAEIAPGLRMLDTPSYRMEFTGNRQAIVPKVVSDLLSPYCNRTLGSWVRLVRV